MSEKGEESDTGSSIQLLAEEEKEPLREPNYRQYLHRLFGEATAEYFLSHSTQETDTPPWYAQMMDRMGDSLSAEAVWSALNDRTRNLLMEIDADQDKKLYLDAKGMQDGNNRRHLSRVRLMYRTAKYREAYTAILLEQNPTPFCLDLQASGPVRYLYKPTEFSDANQENKLK